MRRRVVVSLAIILAISFLVAASVPAAEGESAGQKFKNFWRRLFNYPAKVVEKSGETVATTTKNTTDVVATTVKETTSTVTGQSEHPEKMITEPVKGTVETVATAAKDTVSIPIEAAKETAPAEAAPAAESK
jgi:hypothetical protein